MATSFLVIAPNVIVFERLKSDFGDAATFRHDPLVPPEWVEDFQLTVMLQDELSPITTPGALFLTNVQRLYEPPKRKKDKPIPTQSRRWSGRGSTEGAGSSAEELFQRIASRDRIMVVNDEAHHVWSEKLKWNQSIERLHEDAAAKRVGGRGSGSRRPARLLRHAEGPERPSLPACRRRLPAGRGRRRRDRQDPGDRRAARRRARSWAIHAVQRYRRWIDVGCRPVAQVRRRPRRHRASARHCS